MKGTLLVEFLTFVEKRHGAEQVETIIEAVETELSTAGAYTTVGNYPHSELMALLGALIEQTGEDAGGVVRDFSVFLMSAFHRMHPEFFVGKSDLFEFLRSVGQKIHVEVEKLYQDARPPKIVVTDMPDNSIEVSYQSSRPMAGVAQALIEAAAGHFGQPITIDMVSESADQTSRVVRVARR